MTELLPSYLLRAVLAGLGVAMMTGPLGALVIWQRMAYFGDALAHASLLGITFSLFLAIDPTLGILVIALMVAGIMLSLQQYTWFSNDTLLGLLSHTGLALGLLCFSFLPSRVDLLSYLYGDVLAVTWFDLGVIAGSALIVFAVLTRIWSNLLRIIVHPDLAQVEGVEVKRQRAYFILLLAFVVAMGIKIVGVLLMTAMLIMPAAAARCFAKSPLGLAVIAVIIACVSVLIGFAFSQWIDVPTGPALVVTMGIIFFGSLLVTIKKVN